LIDQTISERLDPMDADVKTPQQTPEGAGQASLQPFLHDAIVSLRAPALVVSRPDGQLLDGVDGFYHADRRALSALRIDAVGVPVASVHTLATGADAAAFVAILRGVGEHGADPAVTLTRRRLVTADRFTERLELANNGNATISVTLRVRAAADLALMDVVKSGRATAPIAPSASTEGLVWHAENCEVRLTLEPRATEVDAAAGVITRTVELGPGQRWNGTLSCVVDDAEPVPFIAYDGPSPWQATTVDCADPRLTRLIDQSVTDLDALLMRDAAEPADVFAGAGAPWYLTLFGRDSLWTARMLLPLGTELAEGTLRVLARRQGRVVDDHTGEQPGKILHEVRRDRHGPHTEDLLPSSYYGTVDATALWLVLLHEAWRWGMPVATVEQLLPAAEAALGWLDGYGDSDGDGFLEYADPLGHGLANQGWKDSFDSVRWRDGRLAEPPIALCEVQAYAYQAARAGAELLRAFDRPGADRWDEWAASLRARFHAAFWVEDAVGPYPAIALDAAKRPVDGLTSNLGHLLGTGLLDAEQSAIVAARLAAPDLDAGLGLRTLSSEMTGFNPLGYHTGSIWPHDTAIAAHGLRAAGRDDAALSLIEGIVQAGTVFGGRLPELFGGHGRDVFEQPPPYPASCRPQAWAAAASVLLLRTLLGLDADVPGGTLRVTPLPAALGHRLLAGGLRVEGLRVAGHPLAIAVDAAGRVQVDTTAPVLLTGCAAGFGRP
jgi:glycogen debranching enzyme